MEILIPWPRTAIAELISKYQIKVPKHFFLAAKFDLATIPSLVYVTVEIRRIHYDYRKSM